jgi:hypothetical protein
MTCTLLSLSGEYYSGPAAASWDDNSSAVPGRFDRETSDRHRSVYSRLDAVS